MIRSLLHWLSIGASITLVLCVLFLITGFFLDLIPAIKARPALATILSASFALLFIWRFVSFYSPYR